MTKKFTPMLAVDVPSGSIVKLGTNSLEYRIYDEVVTTSPHGGLKMTITPPVNSRLLQIGGEQPIVIGNATEVLVLDASMPLQVFTFYYKGMALGGQVIVVAATLEEAQAFADTVKTPYGDRPKFDSSVHWAGRGIVFEDNGDY